MIDLFSLLGFPSFALISLFELFEQRGKRHFFRFRIHLFEICYPFLKPPLGYLPIWRFETVFFAFAVNFLLGIILVVDTVPIQPLHALNLFEKLPCALSLETHDPRAYGVTNRGVNRKM